VRTLRERDKRKQAVQNAIRDAIHPAPHVQIEFEEVAG
jgi:hypothetical protein